MLNRHPIIVNIHCELVSGPFFFGEAEVTNRVTVEGSLISLDNSIIAVDPYRPMII